MSSSHNENNNNNNNNSGMASISPRKEWWKRYEVSNEDFNDCKNNLKEATSYLKTVATTRTDYNDIIVFRFFFFIEIQWHYIMWYDMMCYNIMIRRRIVK